MASQITLQQVSKVPGHDWQNWTMKHLKSEAKTEAEQRIKESRDHADKWQQHGETMEAQRDKSETRCKDDILEADRKRLQAEWQKDVLKTDHDSHIAMLEELVEKERRSAEETQRMCDQMIAQEREICAERIRLAMKKAQADEKRASNTAAEAAETAESQVKHAQAGLDRMQAQCADRVKQARAWAEERVRKCEDLKWEELQKMYAWVKERGEQMDATMRSAENLKHAKVTEAARRVDVHDTLMESQSETEDIARNRGRERFEEWRSTQLKSNASHVLHVDNKVALAETRESHAVNRVMTQSVKPIQR